jgi:hypothetical protein
MHNPEEIAQDFDTHLHNAWNGINDLHEFLSALHRDGVLMHLGRNPYDGALERKLARLCEICNWLSNSRGQWNYDLNCCRLHSPEVADAEAAYKPPAPEVFVPAFAAWPAALRRPDPPATLAQRPTLN